MVGITLAVQRVIVGTSIEPIILRAAVERVGMRAAIKDVRTRTTIQVVISVQAPQRVRAIVPGQYVAVGVAAYDIVEFVAIPIDGVGVLEELQPSTLEGST
jgi:hypothetical protein